MFNQSIPQVKTPQQAFEQAFVNNPQKIQQQIDLSKARVEEFSALAERATSAHWQTFWREMVELHELAILRLEVMADSYCQIIMEVLSDESR